ncbi:TPA: hypothetical protein N6Y52_001983 [Escherichia coli]|nr:hypothetical protein [Escherichia coli]EFA5471506.1 hypothetical protein [Escherichia coli]EFD5343904.1 hypothetical protein [Escherichia coli]HCN5767992.1 hypothetical protein [Escherichia coli]
MKNNKILQDKRPMNVIHGIVCTFAKKVEKTLSRLVTSSNVKKHSVTQRFVRVRKANAHASLCHRYTPTKVTPRSFKLHIRTQAARFQMALCHAYSRKKPGANARTD